jgi:hypothetical protein
LHYIHTSLETLIFYALPMFHSIVYAGVLNPVEFTINQSLIGYW